MKTKMIVLRKKQKLKQILELELNSDKTDFHMN